MLDDLEPGVDAASAAATMPRAAGILYVTADFHGASSAISIRSRFSVKLLCSVGHQVQVLTTQPSQEPCADDVLVHRAGTQSLASEARLLQRLSAEVVQGFRFALGLWRLRARYGLVVLTSPPFFTNVLCALACVVIGKSFVLDVRDRYPQVLFDLGVLDPKNWPGRMLKRLEQWLYGRAFGVLAATHGLARSIESDGLVRVPVLRNGFDAEVFERFDQRPQRDRSPPFRILIHGLFGRLFDTDSFLNIARFCAQHAPAHEFLLAGYGPSLQGVLDAALPNVQYKGHLSHQQVLQQLEQVDLGLSVHLVQALDSFPVKVFEYIGAGVPCVVIPRSEAGVEVEACGMGWSFNNEDWKSCATLITDLMRNPERLDAASRRIREQRQSYSRQHQAKALLEVVQRWKLADSQERPRTP